jgi:hypothetical protein
MLVILGRSYDAVWWGLRPLVRLTMPPPELGVGFKALAGTTRFANDRLLLRPVPRAGRRHPIQPRRAPDTPLICSLRAAAPSLFQAMLDGRAPGWEAPATAATQRGSLAGVCEARLGLTDPR